MSDWFEVTCGVPQGTKVGPVVFLAMVNGVASVHPDRWKCVDDITVAARSKPTSTSNPALQNVMDMIVDTADQDHMVINGSKCATMRISASNYYDLAPLSANDSELAHVPSMKLLGVTLHANLKWDEQIKPIHGSTLSLC